MFSVDHNSIFDHLHCTEPGYLLKKWATACDKPGNSSNNVAFWQV